MFSLGPTNKTLHNSKTIGYRPAGGITGMGGHTVVTRPTIGDHSVTTIRNTSHQSATVTTGTGSHCIVANSGTGSVSRSTAGDHIVPTSKIISQYSTAPYESHSFATNKDNDNKTIHQHAVTKSSVREGHSISRPDQGPYMCAYVCAYVCYVLCVVYVYTNILNVICTYVVTYS